MAQLISLGYRVDFQNKKEKVYHDIGELTGSGKKIRGNLFYLGPYEDTFLFTQCEDVWLWNKRICHVNFDNLIGINKMKRVKRITKTKKT